VLTNREPFVPLRLAACLAAQLQIDCDMQWFLVTQGHATWPVHYTLGDLAL
jgi:hypothetical protein